MLRRVLWLLMCGALAVACTPTGVTTTTVGTSTTGSTAPPPTDPAPPASPTPAVALDAFRSCMAEAGHPVGPLELDPTGHLRAETISVDPADPEMRSALSACAGLLVLGGALDLADDPALAREVRARLVTFAACMRAEGIGAFPDPVEPLTGTEAAFVPEEVPSDAPGFDDAVDTCLQEMGQG